MQRVDYIHEGHYRHADLVLAVGLVESYLEGVGLLPLMYDQLVTSTPCISAGRCDLMAAGPSEALGIMFGEPRKCSDLAFLLPVRTLRLAYMVVFLAAASTCRARHIPLSLE